jgi:hypothetical protein
MGIGHDGSMPGGARGAGKPPSLDERGGACGEHDVWGVDGHIGAERGRWLERSEDGVDQRVGTRVGAGFGWLHSERTGRADWLRGDDVGVRHVCALCAEPRVGWEWSTDDERWAGCGERFAGSLGRLCVRERGASGERGQLGVSEPDGAGVEVWAEWRVWCGEGRCLCVREDGMGIRHIGALSGWAGGGGEHAVGGERRGASRERDERVLC